MSRPGGGPAWLLRVLLLQKSADSRRMHDAEWNGLEVLTRRLMIIALIYIFGLR